MEFTDPYQGIRMLVIWPVLVGCVAFYGVRLLARLVDGALTRWQAILAGVCGAMAAVVTTSIARRWDGSEVYWLTFTLGLAFAALVLLANVFAVIIEADHD